VFAHARALWGVARVPVLFGLLMFVLGVLLAAPTDDTADTGTVTTTVAHYPPEEVTRLADALEAVTEMTEVPPSVAPLVDEARDVLDDVREQTPPVQPLTTSTTLPVTTTTSDPPVPPPTTTTTHRVRDFTPPSHPHP
jgi:hypothetical protein